MTLAWSTAAHSYAGKLACCHREGVARGDPLSEIQLRISCLCYKKRNDIMRILYLLGRNIKFLLLGLFHKLLNYRAIGNTQGNMAQKMPNEIGAITTIVEKRTNPDHE